jgi:dihydroorotase
MPALLVRGGRLIDPRNGVDGLRDVRCIDAHVVEIGEHLEPSAGEEVVEASGAIVAPGFIDMHVHLREPGFEYKETIATGTEAAVRGGFTSVACMPNTNPALDTPETLAALAAICARTGNCRVYPIAAITRGRKGNDLVDYAALALGGAAAFSDDGNTVMNARVLRDAALAAKNVPGVFISHAEDDDLKGDAVMNEGGLSEDVIVARDLLIAMETGKAWHIAHLSTARALELVRWARGQGAAVSCEVTPHHLLLTEQFVRENGPAGKVNPPLRTESDASALRAGVRDGTIDVFATDHAPHTAEEKSGDLRAAAVGFTALEVAVGAYALAVPDLPVGRFIELCSVNPARILGVPGGSLAPGAPADITIFAEREWTVDPAHFASKGRSTPFAGRRLPRRALATIVGGRLAYRLQTV